MQQRKNNANAKVLSNVAVGGIKLYEDVARRIRKANEVTATAEMQMEVLIENSYSYEDLEEKLKPYLNDIDQEISEVINKALCR